MVYYPANAIEKVDAVSFYSLNRGIAQTFLCATGDGLGKFKVYTHSIDNKSIPTALFTKYDYSEAYALERKQNDKLASLYPDEKDSKGSTRDSSSSRSSSRSAADRSSSNSKNGNESRKSTRDASKSRDGEKSDSGRDKERDERSNKRKKMDDSRDRDRSRAYDSRYSSSRDRRSPSRDNRSSSNNYRSSSAPRPSSRSESAHGSRSRSRHDSDESMRPDSDRRGRQRNNSRHDNSRSYSKNNRRDDDDRRGRSRTRATDKLGEVDPTRSSSRPIGPSTFGGRQASKSQSRGRSASRGGAYPSFSSLLESFYETACDHLAVKLAKPDFADIASFCARFTMGHIVAHYKKEPYVFQKLI